MPMLALTLLAPLEGHLVALIVPIAALSLFPLLERDGQTLPYAALTALAAVLLPALAEENLFSAADGADLLHAESAAGSSSALTDTLNGTGASGNEALAGTQAAIAAAPLATEQSVTSTAAAPEGPPKVQLHGRTIAARLRAGDNLDRATGPAAISSEAAANTIRSRRRRRGSATGDAPSTSAPSGALVEASSDAVLPSTPRRHSKRKHRGKRIRKDVDAQALTRTLWRVAWVVSMCGALALHVARIVVPTPAHIPYLHDAMLTAYCFAHFAALYVYGLRRQWTVCGPAEAW